MWTFVRWEWVKHTRIPRFWGSFLAIALLGGLFVYGYTKLRSEPALAAVVGRGVPDGFFVPVLALSVSATVLLPLFVALIGADMVSGERQVGTWPMLLTQGIRPWQLYTSKWTVSAAFAGLATLVLVTASAAGGAWFFGWHSAILPSGVRLSGGRLAMLLGAMTIYCAAGQMVVASWAVAVSAFCRHTVSGVLIVIGVIAVMVTLGDLPFSTPLQPYLCTTYFSRALDVLSFPVNWTSMGRGLEVFGVYTLASWALIWCCQPFRE
jgi:ABC-2 type transport system permease protein